MFFKVETLPWIYSLFALFVENAMIKFLSNKFPKFSENTHVNSAGIALQEINIRV